MKIASVAALLIFQKAILVAGFPLRSPSQSGKISTSTLRAKAPFFASENEPKETEDATAVLKEPVEDVPVPTKPPRDDNDVDVLVIGGGVSGLTAAIKAAQGLKTKNPGARVTLIEASAELGGRVMSETTEDGFVLDKGFAVFIEEYPEAKKLLDYDALKLKPFLPGALVKISSQNKLARVADPLRVPADTISAVLAPVGSLIDKIKVLPLILNVRIKSIEKLFEEEETDTETALTQRWGFSDDFISKFYKPFLEGIYLAPLSEQSSRMFSFVFKMFSEGSATLPAGGMGEVSKQLAQKAKDAGVKICTSLPVTSIVVDNDTFVVDCQDSKQKFTSASVVMATDGEVAQKLLATVPGFENLSNEPMQTQRSVGCLYYSFEGPAPVEDPILILNGLGEASGTKEFPVNNVCFPSVVNDGYAPEGYNLCSVTILGETMKLFEGRPEALDRAVRNQLGTWFQEQNSRILNDWELKKIFFIPNAQPAQLNGPSPASFNGGRPSNTYRGTKLPSGLFVCGDHMATATLNGALESGVMAGQDAAKLAASVAAS